jgi:hypothetical protein
MYLTANNHTQKKVFYYQSGGQRYVKANGNLNNGLNFIGADDNKVMIPHASHINYSLTGTYSFSFWINPRNLDFQSSNAATIFVKREIVGGFTDNRGVQLDIIKTGTGLFRVRFFLCGLSQATDFRWIYTTASFAMNKKCHIAATKTTAPDSSGLNLYVNGRLQPVTRLNEGSFANGFDITQTKPAYIGNDRPGGTGNYRYDGFIVRGSSFNRVITLAETQHLYLFESRLPASILPSEVLFDYRILEKSGTSLIDTSTYNNTATLQNFANTSLGASNQFVRAYTPFDSIQT